MDNSGKSKFRFLISGLVIVIVLLTGILVWRNFSLNKFVLKKLETTLVEKLRKDYGLKVELSRISGNVLEGIDLHGLEISRNGNSLKAGKIKLKYNPWLVALGRVTVKKIVVENPTVRVERKNRRRSALRNYSMPEDVLFFDRLDIRDATVELTDRTISPGLTTVINKINFSGQRTLFSQAFSFRFTGSIPFAEKGPGQFTLNGSIGNGLKTVSASLEAKNLVPGYFAPYLAGMEKYLKIQDSICNLSGNLNLTPERSALETRIDFPVFRSQVFNYTVDASYSKGKLLAEYSPTGGPVRLKLSDFQLLLKGFGNLLVNLDFRYCGKPSLELEFSSNNVDLNSIVGLIRNNFELWSAYIEHFHAKPALSAAGRIEYSNGKTIYSGHVNVVDTELKLAALPFSFQNISGKINFSDKKIYSRNLLIKFYDNIVKVETEIGLEPDFPYFVSLKSDNFALSNTAPLQLGEKEIVFTGEIGIDLKFSNR